jgi:hypothetical protein
LLKVSEWGGWWGPAADFREIQPTADTSQACSAMCMVEVIEVADPNCPVGTGTMAVTL